jgi:uncharacterized surface protein with fasciclin (FAS1) repeats
MTHKRTLIIFLATCLVVFYGCKDKWDDHYSNSTQNSNNLLQQIKAIPELSKFYDYLTQTGYDQVIVSSEFTVWAPTNDALSGLDAAITADVTKLKQFVGNHISYHAYYNNTPDSSLRAQMLNGKHITIYKNSLTVEGSGLITPYDRPCRNGVLHVIDKYIDIKPNIHEYLQSQDQDLEQIYFLGILDKQVIDIAKSTRIGVDSKGNTIYDTVWTNSSPYLKNIAQLDDESQQFTFILLTNKAFDQGFGAIRPYTQMPVALQSDSLAAFYVCADLTIKGKYTVNNLQGSLMSTTGIPLNINLSSIVRTAEVSNGTVIVLDEYPVHLTDKMKPIIVEGENTSDRKFSGSTDFRNVIKLSNVLASGGYSLIYNIGSDKALWVQLTANNVFSTKYKFYWVASNYTYNASNAITTATNKVDTVVTSFNQKLSVNNYNSSTALITFPQVKTTSDYTETLLGEYTFNKFNNAISLRVTGATIKALTKPAPTPATITTFGTPVSVDYIKMVPVIQ